VDEDLRTSLAALAPKLRRFALALTGSIADADDLVQSACERAMRRSDQLREATRLDGWMYGIMRHLWLDEARARRVRRHDDLDQASTTIGTDGEAVAFGRISLAEVRRALSLMSADYRCVLMLVCVDGLSYRDAAVVLDIPIGTVMSRLSRARRELHERLHANKVSGTITPLPLPSGRSRPRTA
jgi:RNA polymerase sigma-70 factor (ECF subfamily)